MPSDSYSAFLLDYVAGTLSPDMALAAELHTLLDSDAREQSEIWAVARAQLCRSSRVHDHHELLPEALELAQSEFDTVPWKRGLSGVHYAKRDNGRGSLMRLDPGQSAPEHGHSVLEATVVLQGTFDDGHGRYQRGDLALGRPGVPHRPAARGDEVCICYVARERLPFWRLS